MKTLTEYCADSGVFMITAHRGHSWEYPENTIPAMSAAVDAGADMIEFDLRATADGIPVLLHDSTIDRTSNGFGRPEEHTLESLKKLNFSYFIRGERRNSPAMENVTIPTFEEILQQFGNKICMNIQVYLDSEDVLRKACELYLKYNMKDRAYMTVSSSTAERIRSISPEIELCITPPWGERAKPEVLRQCKLWGARFVQPIREFVTPETFTTCHELSLRSNVFFTDDPIEATRLRKMGASGILTNRPELF